MPTQSVSLNHGADEPPDLLWCSALTVRLMEAMGASSACPLTAGGMANPAAKFLGHHMRCTLWRPSSRSSLPRSVLPTPSSSAAQDCGRILGQSLLSRTTARTNKLAACEVQGHTPGSPTRFRSLTGAAGQGKGPWREQQVKVTHRTGHGAGAEKHILSAFSEPKKEGGKSTILAGVEPATFPLGKEHSIH